MARVVGIDLGTSKSTVAVFERGEPRLLLNREGQRLTPSYVAAAPRRGGIVVGERARRQAVTNPAGTIYGIKRLLGRKFGDPSIRRALQLAPYRVLPAENGDVAVLLGERGISPAEIAALLLRRLRLDAEAALGEEVAEAVVTVPAYFDDAQRQATRDAGRIAGLKVTRIVNEPTAAALAYGRGQSRERIVAVFDLGGGTFDVSILHLDGGLCEVLASDGDSFLGGDDFDQRIVEWAIAEFRARTGHSLERDRQALVRLRDAAERAKIELSVVQEVEIDLPFIAADASGPLHLHLRLTRGKLEELVRDLVDRTRGPTLRALREAGLRLDQLDEVLLVGGQTRMPAVARYVQATLNREVSRSVNPDEVVALGAAVQAGVLAGEVGGMLLLDVTPFSLGIETTGGVMTVLIPRNTTIPVRKRETFSVVSDGRSPAEIHVLQGERPMAGENRSICHLVLDVPPQPGPGGIARIGVTFDVDASGVLQVSARDELTGRERRLIPRPASGLSPEEVDRLAREMLAEPGTDVATRGMG